MPRSQLTIAAEVGGIGMPGTVVRTGESQIGSDTEPDSPMTAAVAANLDAYDAVGLDWTFTSVGHGLAVGDNIDVYMDDGDFAYGLEVISEGWTADVFHAVLSTTVPGDTSELPTDATPNEGCVFFKQMLLDNDFDSDLVEQVCALMDTDGHCTFAEQTGTALILSRRLTAGELWEWHTLSDLANPFGTGKIIGRMLLSHKGAVTGRFRFGLVYNGI